jgi:putative inorganic carbon (hco3(-)) transporter
MDLILFCIFGLRASADSVFERLPIHVGSMNMTAGALLNLLVLAMAGVLILARYRASFPLKVWIPYLTVASFSVLWAQDRSAAVRTLLVLFTYAGLFAVPFYLQAKRRDSLWLLKAIVYSSFLPVCYGAVQLVFFLPDDGRLTSTFLHANILGCYLNIIIGIICFLLTARSVDLAPRSRKLLLLYLIPIVALILLTQARVAWAGTMFVLVTFAFLVDRRFLLLLVFVPLLALIPAVSDRITDLDRGTVATADLGPDGINSYAWRKLMWESALKDAANTPVLGKGLASFGPNALRFFPLADGGYKGGIGAHSAYIETIYELGYVGLFCYLFLFAGLIWITVRNMRRDRKGAIVILAIIGAYMLQNYSDNILEYGSLNIYFWGTIGTVFAKWSRQSSLSRRTAGVIQPRMHAAGPLTEP